MNIKIVLILLFLLNYACSKLEIKEMSVGENVFNKKEKIKDKNICIIGDAGHGTNSQKEIGDHLVLEKCEHVYYVGDIIYPKGLKNENDHQFQTHFYQPYEKLIKSPFFKGFHIILGNHDYKGDRQVYKKLSKIYPFILENDSFYIEQYEDMCFFIFDTTPFAWNLTGWERGSQKPWLKKQSEFLAKECKGTFAFAHHPYISSGMHGDASGELKEFHEENVIGHFDFLFTGHDHHLSDEGEYQGTKLYVSGAGDEYRGRRRTPYQKGHIGSERGFLKLRIKDDKASLQFVLIDKKGRKKYSPSKEFKLLGLR